MATSNPTITPDWSLVVGAGSEFTFGVQEHESLAAIAVAVTDDASAPTVTGQVLRTPTSQLNRALTGPGYVWAKSLRATSFSAWLHSWAEGVWILAEGIWDDTAVWLDTAVWADS